MMNNLLKQAREMQSKMSSMQKELEANEMTVTGSGGAVTIKINGKQEILDLKINPEIVDPNDISFLELAVKTTINLAMKESQNAVKESMSKITGGMNLPGLF